MEKNKVNMGPSHWQACVLEQKINFKQPIEKLNFKDDKGERRATS
jgi:hypothetical protein